MALVKCRECGAQVSSGAKACVQCGAKPRRAPWKILVGLAVFILFASICGTRQEQAEQSKAREAEAARLASLTPQQRAAEEAAREAKRVAEEAKEHRESARYMCQEFVQRSLHDPDSAKFENSSLYQVQEKRNGVYVVLVQLRAKNAFNALRAASFRCQVQLSGKDDWNLMNLQQVE